MTGVTKKLGVEEYVENFLAENSALRRKLQSKAEALLILSKELDQCRTERDQFKLMAEQLQDRYSSLKRKSFDLGLNRLSLYVDSADPYCAGSTVLEVLNETKEKNKALRIEIEDLRQKLRDSQGDIKVLRRLNQQRASTNPGEGHNFPSHQREELVQQLETMNIKCTQMEADLQSVLDEKEELVTERDAYKCKVHRLNHELNALLKGDGKKILDVDALVMENRYLQDRLQQAEEEKEMANQALTKYKSMLEKKRSKGSIKLGASNSTGMVMTHRQVQQLLEHGTSAQLPNTTAALADMKSLCLALLDALGDKSLALSHQKKANRILARRVSELEERLNTVEGGSVSIFPSQVLLEGYANSGVDREVTRILADEEEEDELGSDSEGETVDHSEFLEQAHRHISIMKGVEEKNCPRTTEKECSSEMVIHHLGSKKLQAQNNDISSMKSRTPKCPKAGENESATLENDALPLQLQLLVQKALDEIKQEEMCRH